MGEEQVPVGCVMVIPLCQWIFGLLKITSWRSSISLFNRGKYQHSLKSHTLWLSPQKWRENSSRTKTPLGRLSPWSMCGLLAITPSQVSLPIHQYNPVCDLKSSHRPSQHLVLHIMLGKSGIEVSPGFQSKPGYCLSPTRRSNSWSKTSMNLWSNTWDLTLLPPIHIGYKN